MFIIMWKLFVRLGQKGWISLIPFYNNWVLFETQNIHGWLSLIPFVNIVYLYIVYYKIAISLGKSKAFAVCTIFFPYVCLPILALDNMINGDKFSNTIYNNSQYQTYGDLYYNNPIINSYNEQNSVSEVKYCSKCGLANNDGLEYCSNCGTKF